MEPHGNQDVNQAPAAGAEKNQVPGDPAMTGAQARPADARGDSAADSRAQDPGADQPAGEASADPGAQAPGTGQQARYQPNIVMDPVTGQYYYVPGFQGQPVQMVQPAGQFGYGTQVPPGQIPNQIPVHPPDYAQIIKSVEDFAEGDASVADVVKTLYSETAQDDQFWKGAIVGAAATVLLTSESVRKGMGKTFGSLFGNKAAASQGAAPAADPGSAGSVDPDKK